MPPRFRSRLLAFALAASVFGCAAPTASARLDGPFRREPPEPSVGQRAATIALRAVGVPYRWGGSSPASGFDCSGLVYWTYGRLGVSVPHSSYGLYGLGHSVRRSRLRPGDVLFFTGLGHVGIYVGRGRMVHAPQSGRTVEVVALDRSDYGLRLVAARRLIS
ncbi:MAG TPA: C40 family peptidase [Gaiellaceae bacterium]|nr:C40 family peptidase [Gaiellaceae bacterium]